MRRGTVCSVSLKVRKTYEKTLETNVEWPVVTIQMYPVVNQDANEDVFTKAPSILQFTRAMLPYNEVVFCTKESVFALPTVPNDLKKTLENLKWEVNGLLSMLSEHKEFLVRCKFGKWEYLARTMDNYQFLDKLKTHIGTSVLMCVDSFSIKNNFTISLIRQSETKGYSKKVTAPKTRHAVLYDIIPFQEQTTWMFNGEREFNIQPSDATDAQLCESREEPTQHTSNYHQPLDLENKVVNTLVNRLSVNAFTRLLRFAYGLLLNSFFKVSIYLLK